MSTQVQADPPPVLETAGLVIATGQAIPDLRIAAGLTVLQSSETTTSTVLALTLAGRMKCQSGRIYQGGNHAVVAKPRALFRSVALAGVTAIDRLERLVPTKSIVREQLVWARPWYKSTPRNLEKSPVVATACDLAGVDYAQVANIPVGELEALTHFRLRVALALIARPEPDVLIVDDVDRLRAVELRRQFLDTLAAVSTHFPVVALSANGTDVPGQTLQLATGQVVIDSAAGRAAS